MAHTGPLFTVAHKTRYASIQRSPSQVKWKKNNNGLANNRCIWNPQGLSAEPIFVREKSKKLTQAEKRENFFPFPYTCFTLSRAPPTRTSTNAGMYR